MKYGILSAVAAILVIVVGFWLVIAVVKLTLKLAGLALILGLGAAQRLVRARLGAGGGEVHFLAVRRSASEGVPIVCGEYEQGGRRQRYIVVNAENAWVEPQMRPGQMDQAVAEYCREGNDNRPPPTTPVPENMQ